MKRSIPVSARLLAVLLVLALALGMFPVGVIAETQTDNDQQNGATVAVIGEDSYGSLAEAVAAAADGAEIKLVSDSVGTGIVIDKSLTINLSGHTYTVGSAPVGSAGTETLGFQILQGHDVKLMNGTVNTSTDEVKMLVQNYSNLTVSNVLLDGTGSTTMQYVLSNNCGNVVLDGSTSIEAAESVVAFDVCDFANYDHPNVTVETSGVINGIVEVSPTGVKLNVKKGILNGDLVVLGDTGELDDATISITGGSFTDTEDARKYIADGLQVVEYGNVVSGGVAQVGEKVYNTLKEAVAEADGTQYVKLLCDVVGPGIVIDKDLIIDFGGHTYTFSCEPVGSAGTETLGFQILKGRAVVLMNGTLGTCTDEVKMLVQNYSNLSVVDMTLDGTGSGTMQYVLSNNCGTVSVKGATDIIAPEGAVALDAYDFSSGGYALPNVTVDTTGKVIGKIEVSDGVSLTVLGGTFSADVTAYLPEDSNLVQVDGTVVKKPVAKIGQVEFATLAEALKAAESGDTVELLYSTEGEGLVINKSVTIDFGGNTYTVNSTVGSAGTETLGLQILVDNTVTLKNGTINTNTNAVKMLVQNYSSLTVEDMNLDGTGSENMLYVLSNNCGTVNVVGATNITAPGDAVAMDACKFASYAPPSVTVDTTGSITGKIEVSEVEGKTLMTIKNGNFAVDVSEWLAEGFAVFTGTDDSGNTYYDVVPEELTIEIGELDASEIVAVQDGKTYAMPGSDITVTVTDASGLLGLSSELSIKDADGTAVEFTLEESDHKWVATVKIPASGLKGLVVEATDNFDPTRTSKETSDVIYAVDTEAPSVDIQIKSANGEAAKTVDGVDYYNGGVEYTVTVKDLLIDADDIKITYTLNGEEKSETAVFAADTNSYTASIKLEADGKLENLKVAATDLSGNETSKNGGSTVVVDTTAPKAELSVEGVSSVVTKQQNDTEKTFLVVGEVQAENEVTVTVTVSDVNLNADSMTDWTQNQDGSWSKSYSTTVSEHNTGSITYGFAVADCAGNKLTDTLSWSAEDASTLILTSAEGQYQGVLHIDCRAPGSGEPTSEAPVLNLTQNGVTVQGGELYSGEVKFDAEINDNSINGSDSGVKNVTAEVDDNLADVEFLTCETVDNGDGTYSVTVKCGGNHETNDAKLVVAVEDNAGNIRKYAYTIAVDNLAPRVELSYKNNDVRNGIYFNAGRELTITVTDINVALEDINVDTTGAVKVEWAKDEATNTCTAVYTFDEGEHSFGLSVTDAAGNVTDTEENIANLTLAEGTEAPYSFIIDLTAPVVKVDKKVIEGEYVRTDGVTDYYCAAGVEYTVTVTDAYLKDAKVQVAYDDGALENVTDVTSTEGDGAAEDQTVFTFTVPEDKVLTDIAISVADEAGNTPTDVDVAGADLTSFEKDETSVWNYTGNDVVADKTAPVVEVVKDVGGNYVQSVGDYDYYDAYRVTYKITVKDAFLDKAVVMAAFDDGELAAVEPISIAEAAYGAEDRYYFEVTVNEDSDLTGLTIDVKDKSENTPSLIGVTEPETQVLTSFEDADGDGVWSYSGNKVAVSHENPVVEVEKTVNNGSLNDKIEDGYDHYQAGSVTYQIKVSDSYLEKAIVTLTYWMGNDPDGNEILETKTLSIADAVALPADQSVLADGIYEVSNVPGVGMDQYIVVFTVDAGETLTKIEIETCGFVGRYPSAINTDAAERTSFADENNDGIWSYSGAIVVIDNTEPEVDVTKEVIEGEFVKTAEGYDYYRAGSVIYTVTVKDAYLTPVGGIGVVTLVWANGFEEELNITSPEEGKVSVLVKDGPDVDTCVFTIVVKDGDGAASDAEILKNIFINAADNAGNRKVADIKVDDGNKTNFKDTDNDGIYEYVGSMVVADITAPVVEVTKDVDDGSYTQSDAEFDYYSAESVTYTVTVKDEFLNIGVGKAVITLTYLDGTQKVLDIREAATSVEVKSNAAGAAQDEYVITFTVNEGDILTGISIDVEDNAGNRPSEIVCSDSLLTTFENKDGVWNYTGKKVVVDNTAPEVVVDKVVSNGSYTQSADGYDYYSAGSVTYTVTVEDNHLNIGAGAVGKAAVTLTFCDREAVVVTPEMVANYASGKDMYVFTFTVNAGETLTGIAIDVADNAGNNPDMTRINDLDGLTSFDEDENGVWNYAGNHVAVDNAAPVVVVDKVINDGGKYMQSAGGYDYHQAGSVTYTVTVTDTYLNPNVGKAIIDMVWRGGKTDSMDISAETPASGVVLDINDGPAEDKYVFTFTVSDGEGEAFADEILQNIIITVEDNAGNTPTEILVNDKDALTTFGNDGTGIWSYTGNMVVVDNTAPDVKVEKVILEQGEYIQTKNGYDYYQAGSVVYTVTVTDAYLNPEVGKAAVTLAYRDGTVVKVEPIVEIGAIISDTDKYVFTFVVSDGQGDATDAEILKNISIDVYDNALNQVTGVVVTDEDGLTNFEKVLDKNGSWNGVWAYTGNMVVVDNTAPVVKVDKEVVEGSFSQSADGFDYYSADGVTYTITVTDAYLNRTVGKAAVTLTYLNGTTETIVPTVQIGETVSDVDTYVFTFTVIEGQPLKGISIDVYDNSKNRPTQIDVTDADGLTAFAEKDGVWNYDGNIVAVDASAPEVKVEKIVNNGKFVKDYQGHDYYDADGVKYTVTVTDAYLNPKVGKAAVTLTYWDGSKQTITCAAELGDGPVVDTYTFNFTVDESKVLTNITIDVMDNAKNTPEVIKVVDAKARTSFANDGTGVWNYTGNGVVVDKTDPVINLTFSNNVETVYINDGTVYVRLADPINLESGVAATGGAETVTMKVFVTDKNLVLDDGYHFGVTNLLDNNGVWSGSTAVNIKSTLTYTQAISVEPDETGWFKYELRAFDLAGNTIDKFNAVLDNGTTYEVKLTNGVFGNNVAVDRRRSSTHTNDILAPEIKVEPNGAANMTATAGGLDLFDGAFTYNLSITDLFGDALSNSGLKSVTWTMTDPVGFVNVAVGSGSREFTDYSREFEIGVPVQFNTAAGESNSVKLTVVATDNADNVITYEKEFAVDNLAPRVELSYSNDDVMNEEYFKEDRVITVKVTDINFNADTTTVNTEVDGSGWLRQGDTYTQTFEYRADGHYTFAMSTTDDANNVTDSGDNDGNLNTFEHVALYKFTVDKTKPVINVSIDGAGGLKGTVESVDYYAAAQTVTVTITEHNFNSGEVVAKLTKSSNTDTGRSLGVWSETGDIRVSKIEYLEDGNRYLVQIDYTDLAGNVAVTQYSNQFTVDTVAPVISIDQQKMSASGVNVVPGALELSFHIADAEQNLNQYTVDVYRLSKTNFNQEKLDVDSYTVIDTDPNNLLITIVNPDESDNTNDGIYTVKLTANDFSLNDAASVQVVYSMNRFGSTFKTDDSDTKDVLALHSDHRAYVTKVEKPLVVTEINPNKVYQAEGEGQPEGSKITVSINGTTKVLVENTDYTVAKNREGTGGDLWYEYVYSINPAVFEVDGRYDVYFYSVDEAGNINSNESNLDGEIQPDAEGNNTGIMSFIVDSQAPVVTILGLDKSQYDATHHQFQINVSDNSPIAVSVELDGVLLELEKDVTDISSLPTDKDWVAYDSTTGNYIVNMVEGRDRNVSVTVTDEADNSSEPQEKEVTISTNWWILFLDNTPLLVGTIVGVVLVLALIIFLIVKRKKKQKPEEAAQV